MCRYVIHYAGVHECVGMCYSAVFMSVLACATVLVFMSVSACATVLVFTNVSAYATVLMFSVLAYRSGISLSKCRGVP